jgi:sec-independent protein translocase protein TatA
VVLAEILGPDLLILLAVAALLFGSSRLPQLARSLGSAKREFEEGIREGNVDQPVTEESGSEKVTMTRAELDALIAEREAAAQRSEPPIP